MSPDSHPRKLHDEDLTAPGTPNAAATTVPRSPREATSRYADLRKIEPASIVLPASRRWLDGLPPNVRPICLAEQYPRLVNIAAVEWNNPIAFRALMADLLIDHRGGRKGFPEAILRELRALHNYYHKGTPR